MIKVQKIEKLGNGRWNLHFESATDAEIVLREARKRDLDVETSDNITSIGVNSHHAYKALFDKNIITK